MSTFTHALSQNNYGSPKFIVATSAANGTHTTLAAALAAASSGDTILLRNSVTENVTLKNGVNITGPTPISGFSPNGVNVTITGKLIDNGSAVTCALTNLQFNTNSDYILSLSNSSSLITFENCFLYGTNNTIFQFSAAATVGLITSSTRSSSGTLVASSGNIYASSSYIAVTTTSAIDCVNNGLTLISCDIIGQVACSGSGGIAIYNCNFSGGSSTTMISLTSSGSVEVRNSRIYNLSSQNIALSSSSTAQFSNCRIIASSNANLTLANTSNATFDDCYFTTLNTTCCTTSDTSTVLFVNCGFLSGSASALSAGTGTTITATQCSISSSNTNAITGAGTLNYSGINFIGTSKVINTTTQSCANSGSFTPSIQFGGAAVGITYSINSGTYYRKDNTIFFNIIIVLTSKGSSVGTATLIGLPFASSSANISYDYVATILNITAASSTYFFFELANNATSMNIYSGLSTSGGITTMTNTNFSNTTLIRVQGTYFV